ncbi:MAG: hypothetical protein AAGK69_14155 [Pseudomonadota bacterium]
MTTVALITTFGVVGVVMFLVYLSDSLVRPDRTGFEMPVLVLILMLILSGSVLIFSDRDDFNVTVVTGLLVAGSALFGLVFNAAVARQTDYRRREEKRRDMRRALRAEIEDFVRELILTENKRDPGLVARAFEQDPRFVPFVISSRRDKVFATVLTQLEVLDDNQVETVVRFYALHEKVVDMAARTETRQYARLAPNRRQAVLTSLHRIEDLIIDYGFDALDALGDPDARDRLRQLSKTGPGRSDREAEA